MPILVKAGSVISTATSRADSARSTEAMSLNSITLVVVATSTAGPTLPARAMVDPSGPLITKVSSTDPW